MVKIPRTLKQIIKKHDNLLSVLRLIRNKYRRQRALSIGDKKLIEKQYAALFGHKPDLDNPKTLNEKIQWLKLNDRKDIYTTLADKYAVREWLAERFGAEYLVPLLFSTTNYKDITPGNIPDIPCIIKAAHSSGQNYICRDKNSVDWISLRNMCRMWLNVNYYYNFQEWQYKNIPPRIIIEKLLITNEGKLPNDYKLHFFNGNLGFVYCSIDREGGNFRNIYSPDWKPLYFTWGGHDEKRGPEITPPESFAAMLEIGSAIAKMFRYVRVDFYNVDGKLYYGEITLHHGSGHNKFTPESYDLYWGEKLDLQAPVQEDIF